ncbi:MAG: IS30 family transposase [Pseudoalteromonas marina]
MKYKQLTSEERYQIYVLKKAGNNQKVIASLINRSASTVSRELKRNKGLRGYRPKQAHKFANERAKNAFKYRKITPLIAGWIIEFLQRDFTPEQIAGRLLIEKKISLHHETIYRFIYQDKANDGVLYKCLPRASKRYRKRYGSYDKRGKIVNRVSIDKRPLIVDKRSRIGDWEGDTILGKGRKNAFITLVERKTLYTVCCRIESKHAEITADALIKSIEHLKERVHTITFDNGKEFAAHERISEKLDADIYFAHAYSSWERGINENTNGLIRRYFPKGTDFMLLSEEDIQAVIYQLNHRPRKTRGFKTPYELFTGKPEKLLAA